MTHRFDAYLSYATADEQRVRPLYDRLKAEGCRIWFSPEEVLLGESIPDAVARGLNQSRRLLLVISQASLKSSWVQHERDVVRMADPDNRQRRILPLLLDKMAIPGELRPFRYLDLTTDDALEKGWSVLLESVREPLEPELTDRPEDFEEEPPGSDSTGPRDRFQVRRQTRASEPRATYPEQRDQGLPPPKETPRYPSEEVRLQSEAYDEALAGIDRLKAMNAEPEVIQQARRAANVLKRQLRKGASLLPGQLVDDRYLIYRELGHGGFATVWRALDRTTGTMIALRVLRRDVIENPAWLERFKRGIKAMQGLEHPHITRVLEPYHEESLEEGLGSASHYVVLECVVSHRQACLRSPAVGGYDREVTLYPWRNPHEPPVSPIRTARAGRTANPSRALAC